MNFSCEKYLLLGAVLTASRAAASKSPIPALEGLLIEAGHDVRISGYDLKKGVCSTLEADVAEAGSIVIGAKILGEIVRSLPDDVVSFKADAGNMAVISCGASEFRIMGSPADDYPELPSVDYKSSVSLKQGVLKKMISETVFAVSDNESRPVHTGALFEIENDELTIVAVDGYRLSLRREAIDKCDVEGCSFVVPGSALSDVEKIASEPEDSVRIIVGSKHVSFTLGRTLLVSRRLEGEFLDYKKAVPKEFKIEIKADTQKLIHAVERVSLMIEDRIKNPVRCVFGENEIKMTCVTAVGRAEDYCEVGGDGGGLEVGFNNRFMLDAFKAAPADEIILGLGTAISPCVISPADGSDGFLYMILPVRLRTGE